MKFNLKNIFLSVGIALFTLALFGFVSINKAEAAPGITAAQTGNWSDTATWVGGVVPTSGYNVYIPSGVVVTIDVTAVANEVIIQNTIGGNTGVIISGSNSLTATNVRLYAPLVDAYSFVDVGSGTLDITVGNLDITGGSDSKISEVTISTGTINAYNIWFFGPTVNARLTSTGASQINIGRELSIGGTLTTSGTGTIKFNGSVAEIMGAYTTYNNVVIANTFGGVTLGGWGVTAISGTLTINQGTLDLYVGSFAVTGATTIMNGGVLQFSASMSPLTFTGNVTINNGGTWNEIGGMSTNFYGNLENNGTFIANTGVHQFYGSGKTISGTVSIPNLYISNTVTNNGILTVDTSLGGDIMAILTNSATGTLNIGGTSNIGSINANAVGNTVNYTKAGAQTVREIPYYNLGLSGSGEKSFGVGGNDIANNLAINSAAVFNLIGSSSTANRLYLNGALQAAGTWGATGSGATHIDDTYFSGTGVLTVVAGPLAISSNGTGGGNWSSASAWAGGIVPGAGDAVTIVSGDTVTVDGAASAASISMNGVTAATNLTISGANTLTVSGLVSLSAPLSAIPTLNVGNGNLIAGSLTVNGGAVSAAVNVNSGTMTVSGNITLNGSVSSLTSTGASTINVGGNFTSSGTLTTSGTGTINFNGNAAQTMGAYTTYNNIVIANTSGGVTLSGATTVGGTLDINSGTLDIGANPFIVTGATTINNGGTLLFSSAMPPAGKTFTGDVTIKSGGTWNETAGTLIFLGGNLQNDGTFTSNLGAHTFTGTSKTISGTNSVAIPSLTITGTVTNNGPLTVSNTLDGAGTLTNGATGMLNIDNDITIAGLIATAAGNTVNYDSTGNMFPQTVKVVDYSKIVLSGSGGSGVKTIGSAINVSRLSIFSGAKAALTGSSTADSLKLNGVLQAAGTWGATGSGATHIDDTYFSGTGLVTVATGSGGAPPAIIGGAYKDTNLDGTVDQIVSTADQTITTCNYEAGDWSVVTPGSVGLSTVTGVSCLGNTITVMILGTPGITGGAIAPQMKYTDQGALGSISSAGGALATVTGSITDGAAPIVVSTTPADASTSQSRSNSIVIVFSEPMNTGSLTFATSPVVAHTPTWTVGNTTLTEAHGSYAGNTTYTATLTGLTDAATTPNTLYGDPYSWKFGTAVSTGGGGGGGGGWSDTAPPTSFDISAASITQNSAIITWETNENSDSLVRFGPTAALGGTASDVALVVHHVMPILGLAAGTAYHYTVCSRDPTGNQGCSGDFTFTTLPPDAPEPTYSAAEALAASPTINADKALVAPPAGTSLPCVSGTLIKLPSDGNSSTQTDSTVYYCGADGKRYIFPDEGTYFSWYKDFSGVRIVSAETLAAIPIGGNVTYRPGSRMLKINYDPKMYAVAKGGVLRWVTSEVVAQALYGLDWNDLISDIPEAFFNNYIVGDPITVAEVAPAAPATNVVTPTPAPPAACSTTVTFTEFLSLGSTNLEVRPLQELLQCLGYFPADAVPTGYFGSVTQNAVKEFQRAFGIAPAGYVGPATREVLNRHTAR